MEHTKMSNLPIEDLKNLIRDVIYDTLYSQYSLFPKPIQPSRREQCSLYVEGITQKKMIHPCSPLQDVMDISDNITLGTHILFDWRKFNSSKIKFCPYCGTEFK